MAIARTVESLRVKKAQVEASINTFEERLKQAKADLAHLDGAIAIFEASGDAKAMTAYANFRSCLCLKLGAEMSGLPNLGLLCPLAKFLFRSICACPHNADSVQSAPIRADRRYRNGVGMAGPYSSLSVANAWLEKASAEKVLLSPMKLQKLMFFSHGYYLAASNIEKETPYPLVDEYFEAWKYGPVLPSIYREFKDFGSSAITRLGLEYEPNLRAPIIAAPPKEDPIFDKVVGWVWKYNAARSAVQLSNITHKVDGAWDRAYKEAQGIRGKDIPNEYILDDFGPLVKKKAP